LCELKALTLLDAPSDNRRVLQSKKKLSIVLCIAVGFGIYFFFNPPIFSRLLWQPNKVVATVGKSRVIGRDILLRMRAMRIIDPNPTEQKATDQLIRGYEFHQILKQQKGERIDQILQLEIEKLDQSATQDWKRAKRFFGNDADSMKRILVIPNVIDKLIFSEGYLKDADFHAREYAEAAAFHKQASREPHRLKNLAAQRKKDFFEGTFSDSKGLSWNPTKKLETTKLPDGLLITQQWNRDFFKELKAGQIAPELIDQGSLWLVVKKGGMDPKHPDTYALETVVFPKKPFLKWLEENRAKIPTKRYGLTSGG